MKEINIKIIFEDNHLLVVEKPVNIPTQRDESGDPDMLTLLKDDIKQRHGKPGNVYLGLVHRLDRPVGGVMVFAKTSKSASRLSDAIRKREFGKTYLAVVKGDISSTMGESGSLRDLLLKDKDTNIVKVVREDVAGGKEALLDYELIQYMTMDTIDISHGSKKSSLGQPSNSRAASSAPGSKAQGLSLVKINLHTGRSHQIRVQLANAGHPLYGDQKYGGSWSKPNQQLALWSHEVSFGHPTLGERMTFHSNPPKVAPWSSFSFT